MNGSEILVTTVVYLANYQYFMHTHRQHATTLQIKCRISMKPYLIFHIQKAMHIIINV